MAVMVAPRAPVSQTGVAGQWLDGMGYVLLADEWEPAPTAATGSAS